jgi:histidinol-phosphate aminotransferase
MALARRHLLNVKSYEAGKPIEEVKRQLGLKDVYKLASNENPLGPSPRAVKAIVKQAATVNRYPDSANFYLKKKIARVMHVDTANIVLGNGSDELIDMLIKTFVEEDENIVTADTTFLEYQIIASVQNREVITAPLKYFTYDLDALRRRINKKTKLVFIANPNNPTGTYVNKTELEEFLRSLPDRVMVVLDEAYDAFIDVADFPNTRHYFRNRNMVILKTFSKSYGLAGVRVGYALAQPEFVSYIERVRQPFNINILAQSAAIAALDDEDFLGKTRRIVLEGKAYLYKELKKMGVPYVPSVANFILVDVGKDCVGVFKEMLKHGVIVRDMRQYGLNNFIRVTIGLKKENEKFVAVLRKII